MTGNFSPTRLKVDLNIGIEKWVDIVYMVVHTLIIAEMANSLHVLLYETFYFLVGWQNYSSKWEVSEI